MTFTPDQVAELKAPLNRAHVAQRAQAGRSLSYIEAWHAIAEANRIFGFDAWNRETVELRQLGEPRLVDGKYRVGYSARVRITVNTSGEHYPPVTITREGCGFGSGIDKDVDQAHESALKEAESDAMKRALMTFGNPFGLALYDKTQANVASVALPGPQDARPQGDVARPEGATTGRKSAAQAKRDSDDAKIKREIGDCDREGLRVWHENFDRYTAHVPFSWLDSIRDMLEQRLGELNGAESVAEAEAELDAGFRGATGGGSPAPVAGRGSAVAA